MPTLVLTGAKPTYNRPAFLQLVLKWVTTDITAANQYVDAVLAGQSRDMVVPGSQLGIIATELDLAGIVVRASFVCTATKPAPAYNRPMFLGIIVQWVGNTPPLPDSFANDVQAGTARIMTGPPSIIATELDAAGVVYHVQ